jgi:uncharacterized protein (UPF0335 family)
MEAAMKIPENLRDIVDRLGTAMVQALAKDEETRALAREIQAHGFDIALVLEATVALRQREDAESARDGGPRASEFTVAEHEPQWSEADKAFLRTFRISM